jgi:hypothetical protein
MCYAEESSAKETSAASWDELLFARWERFSTVRLP